MDIDDPAGQPTLVKTQSGAETPPGAELLGGCRHGRITDAHPAVLRGALAVGVPSYDAVMAEHVPQQPGSESCRSCGFVYSGQRACPAVILAVTGFVEMADQVRVVPAADREYGAMCELTVAVQRLGARLDVIGASVAAVSRGQKARPRRPWAGPASLRRMKSRLG